MEGKSMFNKDTYKYKPILLLLSVFIFILLSPLISQASPNEIDEDGVILFRYSEEPSFMKTTPLTGENDSSELDNNLGHSPVGYGEPPKPGFWEWVQNTIKDFFSGEKDEKEESSWWDRVTNGVGNFFESVGDFFGSVGEWVSDIWDGLSDWTKDLIVTIGIIVAVVIGVVLVVVLLGLGFVVGLVGSLVAIIAGVTYFLLYGGTDQFNPFHAFLWTVTGAITGVVTTVAVVALQASGALAALLNLGRIKLVELALTSRIYFWITNSLRIGLANTLRYWFNAAGTLFLRFSTGLYLTGMRVLTAFTGWLNVARLGVLRFSTNMYVVFNNLLIRFNSFVATQWRTFSNWLQLIWAYNKATLIKMGIGGLLNAIGTSFYYVILISNGVDVNKMDMLIDIINSGLFGAVTFGVAGVWKSIGWQKRLQIITSIGILGGGLDYLKADLKGETTWVEFASGFIANVLLLRLGILLIPETASRVRSIIGSSIMKGATDFISNRIKDIIYWNNPLSHKNLIKDFFMKVRSRYYEIGYYINQFEQNLIDYIFKNYYRP